MDLYELLDQVVTLLRQRGRLTYRAVSYQFKLDAEGMAALKEELIEGQRVATDEDGKVLVWTGEQLSAPPPTAAAGSISSAASSCVPEAERRQLTVMFCDLVGSTTLSERLDPEELREIIRAYQQTSAEVIERFGGHIAQYLGDGLLVYFGYPVAHEDDAARAVRAGLGIVEAVWELNTRMACPIQVRVGIHTGLVVIGEVGGGRRQEQLAVGETPNIAARVQAKAQPDSVCISAATYRLIQGLFESRALGPQKLAGVSAPLALYWIVSESDIQTRFEVAVRAGLTPLVGREQELGFLQERWERAKGGEGHVILLSGEPGIGKSRLVQELKDQAVDEDATASEFRCSPYHQNSALYPIITHLERLLQFEPDETPQTKLDKLHHTLTRYRFPQPESVLLLAALLSLPHPALTLSPQKQREKTEAVLLAWLVEEADRNAVYSVWEDLHWADPSTLTLLGLMIAQLPATRLFVVCTYRPEFTPPWVLRSHMTQFTLSRLGQSHVESMVEKLTGGRALPQAVLQHITNKTDGVPLFVEELTKTVVELGVLKVTDDRYELSGPVPALSIPTTLQDSLMARLDRLRSAKEIAQLGATLGREFSYALLAAVSPLDEPSVEQGLRQLVEAELIYQRGVPPQARYTFKHALIQDAAYQSLLKGTRQHYHQQIAQVLEERFPEIRQTQPELVAHHYTEAGLAVQAIPYWQRAGERAAGRSANLEAISHLTHGLAMLEKLPNTPERTHHELMLQVALGAPLMSAKGWAAPEVEAVYSRARELCQQVGGTPQLFPVLYGLWAHYIVRRELLTSREMGEQGLRLAQRLQDPAAQVGAHFALGNTLFWMGELLSAHDHLEQGIALYDSQQHPSHVALYGWDLGVGCLFYTGFTLWVLGSPDQALKRCQKALTLAQALSHPPSLAWACLGEAFVQQLCRDGRSAKEQAAAAMQRATEQEVALISIQGGVVHGWALTEQGQAEAGLALMRQRLAAWLETGTVLGRSHHLAHLAGAYRREGRWEEGLGVLAEALALLGQTAERSYEAELYRLKGELLLAQETQMSKVKKQMSKEEEAEACFHKALDVARHQQAKCWELRAATSLARLWQQQGKQAEACDLLAPVYNWFTEGFDTRDLQEAKALLGALLEDRAKNRYNPHG